MFLTVGVVSLTTGNRNRKDNELIYYFLIICKYIYKQCAKIEYTPNFISDNQFKHCYNIKNCTDCGENS